MSQENQQTNAQQRVVQQELAATQAVEYTDESVAKQIFGTTNVAQAVHQAEQQALQAVVATE
ncbi:hypothetical protein L2755_19735 [Shewanella abyssi]|uniref:hypothetical protein n=1 Tax=Shewanella abyssi TaxID=311789 RepID=UPI00200E93EB|nr:hypothetical protein [Shewanella abyssi]MCL1051838.1 hypothetical protein [Shewanella abyssi]